LEYSVNRDIKYNLFQAAVNAYVITLITFSVSLVNEQGIIQDGWKF